MCLGAGHLSMSIVFFVLKYSPCMPIARHCHIIGIGSRVIFYAVKSHLILALTIPVVCGVARLIFSVDYSLIRLPLFFDIFYLVPFVSRVFIRASLRVLSGIVRVHCTAACSHARLHFSHVIVCNFYLSFASSEF